MKTGVFTAVLAALLLLALPASGARRFPNPYPCSPCLFTVGIDGKGLHPLELNLGSELMDFSPKRKLVAFFGSYAADFHVYVGRIDGTHVHAVASNGAEARFSPDGRKIAFDTPAGGTHSRLGCGVWIVGTDGRGLTPARGGCARLIAWAPDSSRLMMNSQNYETLIIAAPGSAGREIPLVDGGFNFRWSPRGDRFSYVADSEAEPASAIGGSAGGRAQTAPQEVRVVRPDGSVVRRYASATDAWWSPDGRSLGLDHDDRPYYDVPPSQPYVDHHSLRIARVPGAPGQPRAARAGPWSPDGRWMAATDGYTDVWVIPVRGGPARRVASLEPEGDIDEIWWSLDGKRLFFSWVFTSLD